MTSTNEQLVSEILSIIKTYILAQGQKGCDVWNNGLGGVGWIDNEVGFIEEAFYGTSMRQKHLADFSGARTVVECRQILNDMDTSYLSTILTGVRMGGTSSQELWKIVKQRRSNV